MLMLLLTICVKGLNSGYEKLNKLALNLIF